MTEDKNAQEVQEYTPAQAEKLKEAAARITGKPITDLTVEDAEAALFAEIGYTTPPTPAQAARQIIMQRLERDITLREALANPDNTALAVKVALQQAAALKMRIVAVRAGRDTGADIEQKAKELLDGLKVLQAQLATDDAALEDIATAMYATEEVAAIMLERRTKKKLDFADISEAEKQIEENPAIMGFIPEDCAIQVGINDQLTALQQSINAIANSIVGDSLKATAKIVKSFSEMLPALVERMEQAQKIIGNFLLSEQFKKLSLLFGDIAYWIDPENESPEVDVFWLSNFIENIDVLMPYIEQELEQMQAEHGVKEFTFAEFINDTDPETGERIESIFEKCVKRAQAAAEFDLQAFAEDTETAGKEKKQLPPQLDSKLPKRYLMPNTALANILPGKADRKTGELIPAVNVGAFDLPVMKSGKPGEVTAYTLITLDPGNGVTLTGRPFTNYDRCVMNSTISLWEAGNDTITPEMVCRTMANKTESEYISPQQIAAVTKSIEKMRYIHVYCDLSEEMQKRKITDDSGKPVKFVVDDFLLVVKGVTVTAGGKTKKAYKLTQEPILLTHAKINRQLVSVNTKMLDVRRIDSRGNVCETIANTENRQQIKEYLLRRIEVMKHDRKNKVQHQSTDILFDSLYRDSSVDTSQNLYLKKAREYAFQVLDYWKAIDYIKGYTVNAQGRTKYHSITIKL